jgi:hypothetical protein
MRSQSDEYNKVYDSMARLFTELERIGDSKGPLDNIFDRLIRIEVIIQKGLSRLVLI